MVIPPPERAARVTRFLKPYLLRMHFTNKYVSAQVIHTPTSTVACSASSQEKLLRPNMESTRDVAAAAKIGKLLGERLLLKGIYTCSVHPHEERTKVPWESEGRYRFSQRSWSQIVVIVMLKY